MNYVAAGYATTAAALAVYAWRLIRRGRALSRDVPDEERPWR